jgi:uncharacterized SAM-binding protein YcdF (DUF218 family)
MAAIGAVLVLITFTPGLRLWISILSRRPPDGKGRVLIVLGGDMLTPEIVGVTTYRRTVFALFCWREGHYETLVLSGQNLAIPMRGLITFYGIPREAILIESRSQNTHENALFTAQLLRDDPREKVLITSDYHMFRASRAFRRAGLNVAPLPFPDAGNRIHHRVERWPVFCVLMAETAGIAYHTLRGWI